MFPQQNGVNRLSNFPELRIAPIECEGLHPPPLAMMRAYTRDNTMSDQEQQRRAQQRVMSLSQFCERYGPGRTKAYEEIKSGRLRGRKIGKRK